MSGIEPYNNLSYSKQPKESPKNNYLIDRGWIRSSSDDKVETSLVIQILNELSSRTSYVDLASMRCTKYEYKDSELAKIDSLLIRLGFALQQDAPNQFSVLLHDAILDLNISFGERILHAADLCILRNDPSFIMDAITKEASEWVKLLLDHDFRPDLATNNEIQPSVLHMAVFGELDEIVEMLIVKHQENLKHPEDFQPPLSSMKNFLDIPNRYGNTPLIVAIQSNNLKIANLLIQHGANLNHQNNLGETALHIACRSDDDKNMLDFLFSFSQLNPNLKNKKGETPLMCAILNKCTDNIDYLVANDSVNLLLMNKDSHTAMSLAKKALSNEAFEKLKNHLSLASSQMKDRKERIILAHISDTEGSSLMEVKTSETEPLILKFRGAAPSDFLHYISKRTLEFEKLGTGFDSKLLKSLAETAEISSKSSIEELFARWEARKAIYLDIGWAHHAIGMYICRDEIVWCNRWSENAYHAFRFNISKMSLKLLKRLKQGAHDGIAHLEFLNNDLQKQLQGSELSLHDKINKHRLSVQTVGNCSWKNLYSLQLIDCIFYAVDSSPDKGIEHFFDQYKGLIKDQAHICDNLLSYFQCYPILKALKRIEEESSPFEPDYALVARAFTACYPYSKTDLDPAVFMKWEKARKLYLKNMPSLYIDKFLEIRQEQDEIQQTITDANNLLKRFREYDSDREGPDRKKQKK